MQAQLYDFTRELHSLNQATKQMGRSFFRLSKMSSRFALKLLSGVTTLILSEPELYKSSDPQRKKEGVEMKKNNYIGTHPPSLYHF